MRPVTLLSFFLVIVLALVVLPACDSDDDTDGRLDTPGSGNDHDNDDDDDSGEQGYDVGDIAPDLCLDNDEGEESCLSDHDGNVVLLTVMAAWCPACDTEAGNIVKTLHDPYHERGFDVFMVLAKNAADGTPSQGDLEAWRAGHNLPFNVMADPYYEETAAFFPSNYIPLNIVLDRDRVIRYSQTGYDPYSISNVVNSHL